MAKIFCKQANTEGTYFAYIQRRNPLMDCIKNFWWWESTM